eukprot:CAMPEP_0196144344 /NCGR_PEP_ID=MMETSP0910-20130528/15996_1 /TAXON_ID=49265 /ORGANISM="Thalassiosira rotula, Strain GSO102" /LENGTH=111 /DNA_ID=CAMNT_0041405971 /DNA_START=128 /DNA_END=464 /DNA_ORIENTATION=+
MMALSDNDDDTKDDGKVLQCNGKVRVDGYATTTTTTTTTQEGDKGDETMERTAKISTATDTMVDAGQYDATPRDTTESRHCHYAAFVPFVMADMALPGSIVTTTRGGVADN